MYFEIKAALRTLVLPPASPLIVVLVGWAIARHYARAGRVLMVSGWICLWLLCTEVFADRLWFAAQGYPALDLTRPVDAQAVVIIGGGGQRKLAPEYATAAPAPLLLERLAYGAYVAKTLKLPILISGAPLEISAMRASLIRDFGVEPRWIEGESRDTYQNSRFTRKILRPIGIERIVLVTMSTHLWRATHEFQDAGFVVTPAPSGVVTLHQLSLTDFVPTPVGLVESHLALYELIGEPMRRLQAALGVRELLDKKSQIP